MPTPFQEALAKLAARAPVGADLSSSEWADVPLALRERAMFSARVYNTQVLQQFKDLAESIINPRQVARDGRLVTEGDTITSGRARAKEFLKSISYDPGDKAGTIQDLSSDARLNLILKMNVEDAQGRGNFIQGNAAGAVDEFPAQELFRAEDREEPRDWPTRWMQAGGQIFSGGRMIALKNDPIWTAISAFGKPWPPFDYNSGMWVRDVDRETAEQLGLLVPGQTIVAGAVPAFNAELQASGSGIAPELLQSLQQSFGNQVVITGDTIKWAAA